ncbi:MAG: phosphotransferase, partial [Deltaproteobacteria bacterium]|nr:phosphotransferase [Deltaproteobacteria bacterium]
MSEALPSGEVYRFAGRFESTRLLKSSKGVDTHLAIDLESGSSVVVKAAQTSHFSAPAERRLEHEAAALRDASSRFRTPLLAFGHERDRFFLVIPFVQGITLERRLAQGPLSVDETLAVGACLLAALDDAHQHGVLHRDVKPGNVIVNDGVIREATLIDFGFSRSDWLDPALRDEPVGTALYLSPEQAGLL